ncbi:TetR/AcrR family transcriptional regulator [Bradyrhizobium frederickii]|uniref:TetR/AcrR family transcriptional regulator n=1 Tax=Bradyrhizobium frederickii TaxID=2560054 RepID=UPI001F337AFE|nr:TetR/AcrR family transcriptional regulator [Bradyrhizobium frederickii]
MRILDAAQQLFLAKGYRSSSIDEISELAPASKPTIYAHFPGKQALFAAVMSRTIDGLTDFHGFMLEGRTVEDKLTSLGTAIVDSVIDESLGVVRATIAEAQRFPELSRNFHDAARERSVRAVSRLLSEADRERARDPEAPIHTRRRQDTAQIFLDLILLPILLRSLHGERPAELRSELASFIKDRVGFFLSACEPDRPHRHKRARANRPSPS